MSTIVLFHSMLGQRPGFFEAAERLRSRGHEVVTPDLLEGAVFDDYAEAQAHATRTGLAEVFKRAALSTRSLPAEVVYAGFSLGAACALGATARKPGALACVAVAGVVAKADLRVPAWPSGIEVQVHFAAADPGYDRAKVALLGAELRESGSRLETFEYGSGGHLFADPSLPAEYDRGSAEAMWERIFAMLDTLK
jgi:dienelactone hydrolase